MTSAEEADRLAFTSAAPPVTAISVANRELPPVPEGLQPDDVTLVLFYQYIEPAWSKRAHKKAVATVLELCKKNAGGVVVRWAVARRFRDFVQLRQSLMASDPQVRQTPSWPRSWANFSLF